MLPLLGLVALLLVCALLALFPRQMWIFSKAWRSWQYENPDAVEPSGLAVGWYRLTGVLGLVGLLALGGYWLARENRQNRCEDIMNELADVYADGEVDDVRRGAERFGVEAEWSGGDAGSIVITDDGHRLGEITGLGGDVISSCRF